MSKFNKKAKPSEQEDLKDVIPWEVDPEVTIAVDMDEQVFKVASACEEKFLQYTNKESKESGLFKNKTQFKKFMTGVEFDPDMFESEEIKKPEKISFAINTLKRRLNNICKDCKCHPDNMELYIDGVGNFRNDLPLAVQYKGARKDKSKPALFEELKQYAIDRLHSEVINGKEVDDVVCIRVHEGNKSGQKVIGVSVDKDSRQVEGWWYSYGFEPKPSLVKGFGSLYMDNNGTCKGDGWKFLYVQILNGDPVDCYSSRDVYGKVLVDGEVDPKRKKPRWGDKSTYDALDKCTNHKQCLELIVKKYKQWYGEDKFEYEDWQGNVHKATWLDVLDMQFQLAYMKRSHTDKTCIRNILKKVKIIE